MRNLLNRISLVLCIICIGMIPISFLLMMDYRGPASATKVILGWLGFAWIFGVVNYIIRSRSPKEDSD